MRILFLTNFYLVHGAGGEEQSCQQVIEGLKQRGHTTLVLTSMHGTNNKTVETEEIYRSLYLEMDLVPWRHSITFFTKRKAREKHNLKVFERVLQQFDPDIIFIWGMWNLPTSLPAFAETRYPNKVVYRFASYWPTLPSQHEFYWRTPGRNGYSRILKHVLGRVALAILAKETQHISLTFLNAICVSAATRDVLVEAGVPVSHARIIHTGLEVERYLNGQQHQKWHPENQQLNLLYAGRLTPEKGIETIIEAMSKLVHGKDKIDIKLSLAGSGALDYENSLHQLVEQLGLTDNIVFLGWVAPSEMPKLLKKFDVLVVPSSWPEPFARVVLEGMISGLAVIAARTGGTPEMITDGESGLLFTANDAEDLTQKILYLLTKPELRRKLALTGQQKVLENFTSPKMMDEIENYLQEIFRLSLYKQANQLESK